MRLKSAVLTALLVCATAGFAAENQNAASLNATLTVNVNVTSALRLVIKNGAAAPNCAIPNSGSNTDVNYTIDLGNVNGLGVASGGCAQVDTSGANPIFWSNYIITPSFSGFANSNGNIDYTVTTEFSKAFLALTEGAGGATPTTVRTNAASPYNLTATAATGVDISRAVGVQVTPFNGAGATGADTAVITYTLTVP